MRDKFISAREIVKKYHLSYQKVNRYTDAGLLRAVLREGNMRLFNRQQVHNRLRQISLLSREGYSFRLIRRKLIGI
ncbi:MAG: helix-turn-helix domain-containing protein [Candidatus Omnitrophica bacterium]|nr:helix-turn-helix domain-containing protein [Candidatus Omnitrophota bacterium]